MDHAIAAAIAPFMLAICLLIARPFKKRVERMRDGKLKRFLLIRWN